MTLLTPQPWTAVTVAIYCLHLQKKAVKTIAEKLGIKDIDLLRVRGLACCVHM